MKTHILPLITVLCGLAWTCPAAPGTGATTRPVFDLRDGERILFLGDSLMEGEQRLGYLETLFTSHYPHRNLTFRHLERPVKAADAPFQDLFAYGKPDGDAVRQLTNQIAAWKPGVVVLGFGIESVPEEEAGAARYATALTNLVGQIQSLAGAATRVVVLGPLPREPMPPPARDPEAYNDNLNAYYAALQGTSQGRDWTLVTLMELVPPKNLIMLSAPPRRTDDGLHPNANGYQCLAELVAQQFKWEPHIWRVGLLPDGQLREGSYGHVVTHIKRTETNASFETLAETLVSPPQRGRGTNTFLSTFTPKCMMQVMNLKPGNYTLKIDGRAVKDVTDQGWQRGTPIQDGAMFEQAEQLRLAIVKKNDLVRQQWRARAARGANAAPGPTDQNIAAAEAQIAKWRKPAKHTFEVVPAGP